MTPWESQYRAIASHNHVNFATIHESFIRKACKNSSFPGASSRLHVVPFRFSSYMLDSKRRFGRVPSLKQSLLLI